MISGLEMEACIRKSFAQLDPRSISSVVLGCTHFGFLAQSLKKVLGDHVRIADGNEGTIRNLKKILEQADLLNSETTPAGSTFELYNSGGPEFIKNSKAMLKEHLAYLKAIKA